MKTKNNTSWKIFGIKSANFFLLISLIFFATNCGSRKTESTKEKENLQSLINLKSTSLNWDGFFSSNNTIVVEREKYLNGVISEKETKSINNQTQNKQILKYNNFNIYKTITTYKTVYVKQTERVEAKNYWIVLCVLVISIVTAIYFYTKRPLG
jgi:hypothetical protein